MTTIVTYTDRMPPENHYPRRIVSPPRSGPCCFSDMEGIGERQRDGNWEYIYKRCRTCGFTVRMIEAELPDPAQAALVIELRKILAVSFSRNAAAL
jgi:hypothetical protein